MFTHRKDVGPLIQADTWHRYATLYALSFGVNDPHLVYLSLELMLRGCLHLT